MDELLAERQAALRDPDQAVLTAHTHRAWAMLDLPLTVRLIG